MTKTGRRVLSMLLWSWGGTVYFLLEVAFKTLLGEPDQISWTMLVLAVILTVAVERCGYQLPWEIPLWLQALVCALLVTAVELAAGVILNIWLGLDIWDYSHLPFNLWGQICPHLSLHLTGCAGPWRAGRNHGIDSFRRTQRWIQSCSWPGPVRRVSSSASSWLCGE